MNLARTKVVSPVNGVVTNLDLQPGFYATTARPVMALIDSDSFYVEGYFEETKLPRIQLNDRDRSVSANLLPSINPTFNWVRLAQRIPVRIKLAPYPADVRLISGQTATVVVHPANDKNAKNTRKDAPAQ